MTIFPRAVLALLLLVCAAPARAQRRPLNYRRRKKQSEAAKAAEPPSLLGKTWSPEARAAVRRFVEVRGSSSPVYNADAPPAAALALDGAAFFGDPAEAVFHKLVVEAEFRFSDDFWKQVPLGYGRQKIRAAHEQFSGLPKSLWPTQPAYHQFRKFFLASYQETCRKVGRKECRGYLAKLLIGFTEEEAREYAKAALAEEAAVAPALDREGESDVDPAPVFWPRGLAVVPEFAQLVGALRANGVDVWAAAPEPQAILVEAAALAGVDASRCLGIKQGSERSRYDGNLREPLPIRGGAVDAVVSALGRPPDLVLAARLEDLPLLEYTAGVRLVLDDREAELRRRAKLDGAVLQPLFAVLLTKRR